MNKFCFPQMFQKGSSISTSALVNFAYGNKNLPLRWLLRHTSTSPTYGMLSMRSKSGRGIHKSISSSHGMKPWCRIDPSNVPYASEYRRLFFLANKSKSQRSSTNEFFNSFEVIISMLLINPLQHSCKLRTSLPCPLFSRMRSPPVSNTAAPRLDSGQRPLLQGFHSR